MNLTESVVLFVDDEPAACELFEKTFGQRFTVRTASRGFDALATMESTNVGVLLAGHRLPDITGSDLMLHAREKHPRTVRVLLAGHGDYEAAVRAAHDGLVARCVGKPWQADELESVLSWANEAAIAARQNPSLISRLTQTERLITLGSINSVVIHDLNQPLSYLLSNSERLNQLSSAMPVIKRLYEAAGAALAPADRRRVEDLVEEFPEIVRDMLDGCRLMQGLTGSVRQLLKRDQSSVGRLADPVPAIRHALSVCREITMSTRGTLAYDGPETSAKLRIGQTELSLIMINLLTNAAKAIVRRGEPGGRVSVSISETDTRSRIQIVDNGDGMSDEVLANLGRPFFSTLPDGTGIGITQCQRLVHQASGELKFESKPGSGTTVTVVLPKA